MFQVAVRVMHVVMISMLVAVIVVMMMIVIVGGQELRLDIENAIEVEGVTAEHFRDVDLGALGAVQPRIRIDAADARLDLVQFRRRHQIGLVDQDDVGKGDLVLGSGRVL